MIEESIHGLKTEFIMGQLHLSNYYCVTETLQQYHVQLTDIIHLTAGYRLSSTSKPTLQGPSFLHYCRTLNYRVHVQNTLCIGGPAGTKHFSKSPSGSGAGVWQGPSRRRWTGPYSCPLGKPVDSILTSQSPTGQSVGSLPFLDLKVLVHTRRHRNSTCWKWINFTMMLPKWFSIMKQLHIQLELEKAIIFTSLGDQYCSSLFKVLVFVCCVLLRCFHYIYIYIYI